MKNKKSGIFATLFFTVISIPFRGTDFCCFDEFI